MQREEGEEVGTEKMMMSMGSKRPQHLRERERELLLVVLLHLKSSDVAEICSRRTG